MKFLPFKSIEENVYASEFLSLKNLQTKINQIYYDFTMWLEYFLPSNNNSDKVEISKNVDRKFFQIKMILGNISKQIKIRNFYIVIEFLNKPK